MDQINSAFSEYVLYEPTLRILTARQFEATREVICEHMPYAGKGDRKRLDFVARQGDMALGIEVKWADEGLIDNEKDLVKLVSCRSGRQTTHSFLVVFGTFSNLEHLRFSEWTHESLRGVGVREFGEMVTADSVKTRYACRVYEVT